MVTGQQDIRQFCQRTEESHRSIALRSKEWPSAVVTGSCMTCRVTDGYEPPYLVGNWAQKRRRQGELHRENGTMRENRSSHFKFEIFDSKEKTDSLSVT